MYDDSVNYRHTSNNKAVTCPRGLNAAWKDLLLNEIQIFENFVTVYNIYCDYTNVYMFSFDNPLKGQIKFSWFVSKTDLHFW